MQSYFRPWRRKVGVVMLALACVVMVGWARSLVVVDEIQVFVGRNTAHQLISSEHGLVWVSTWGEITDPQGNALVCARVLHQPHSWTFFEPSRMIYWERTSAFKCAQEGSVFGYNLEKSFRDIRWNWKWMGFCCGTEINGPERAFVVTVPYWSIVIPLILLSAWALFSKPRFCKPKPASES